PPHPLVRPSLLLGSAAALEVLNRAFVLLRRGARRERAEVATPARSRVLPSRVQAVLAGCELANHAILLPSGQRQGPDPCTGRSSGSMRRCRRCKPGSRVASIRRSSSRLGERQPQIGQNPPTRRP